MKIGFKCLRDHYNHVQDQSIQNFAIIAVESSITSVSSEFHSLNSFLEIPTKSL